MAMSVFLFLFSFLIVPLLGSSIDLNGRWQVINSNQSIRLNVSVPGGIYTDLLKNNIIEDPYYRFNDVIYRWVAKDSWTYSREFEVPVSVLSHKTIMLICEGLDTIANLSINGHWVGLSKNMFVRYGFDIKPFILKGTNTISVSFLSPIEYAKEEYEKHLMERYSVPPICPPPVQKGECHPNFIRKIQSQFSWDWGPAFPSMGIWKPIKIEAYDSAVIRNIMIETIRHSSEQNKTFPWEMKMKVLFETSQNQSKEGSLSIMLDSTDVFKSTVTLSPDENNEAIFSYSFAVPLFVETWWPNGLGDQPLYNLQVKFTDEVTQEETTKVIQVGFRTVELVQEPIANASGLSFYFKINGVPVFMKGSNWIPADSFPERITPEYVELLLQSSKDAHMNVLRVWGGGMYETDVFYELADRMGLLIWQDMMFACAMYPATEEFLSTVRTEVRQQIQRLQHHPSILIWSGNNENEAALVGNWYFTKSHFETYKADYIKLYIDTLKPLISELDPSRPYLTSSPSNGIESEEEGGLAENPYSNLYGDVHFYNYLKDSWNWTLYPRSRFVSEYGFQSWPSFESLKTVSSADDWSYFSEFADHRQHHSLGNIEMMLAVIQHMKWVTYSNDISLVDVKSFQLSLYLTQIYQAMSIKTETEFYRRSQSEIIDSEGHTMGALYWQLNDIWQGPSWASLEFGGKWKMLHYFATHFFAPHLISPYEDTSGNLIIYSVSDSVVIKTELMKLAVMVYRWDNFTPLYSTNVTVSQLTQKAQKIYEVPMATLLSTAECPDRSQCFLYFILTEADSNYRVSSNFLFLSSFQEAAKMIQRPQLKAVVSSKTSDNSTYFSVEITSKAIAPFVWLEVTGIQGRFSDNGFLLVDQKTTVDFYPWQNTSEIEVSSSLSLISLEDTL